MSGTMAGRTTMRSPAAKGHEGQAFLRRLQAGVDRRAGGVLDGDRAAFHRTRKARRQTEFAQRNGRSFQSGDTAGADQHVGLQAGDRHRHQVQVFHPAADQRQGGGHRHAALVLGDHQFGAIGHHCGQFSDADEAHATLM
jgi:hypothetical protein